MAAWDNLWAGEQVINKAGATVQYNPAWWSRLLLAFHWNYIYHVLTMVYQVYQNVTVFWNILPSWCVIFTVAVLQLPRMITGPFFMAACNPELPSDPIKSAVHYKDNCSGRKLSWPEGWLGVGGPCGKMFRTKWPKKSSENWDSIKLLPSVFH